MSLFPRKDVGIKFFFNSIFIILHGFHMNELKNYYTNHARNNIIQWNGLKMESRQKTTKSGNFADKHHEFMVEAEKEAIKSLNAGGIPVGAVLVKNGEIIGRGHNQRIQLDSAILHAEMVCLENAGRMKADDYKNCTLYTTLSPCDMCSGAIILYQIPIVVMGENENFKGPEAHLEEHGICLLNLNLESCKKLLKSYIQLHSQQWNEDIGV